jgi:hypothetical protein
VVGLADGPALHEVANASERFLEYESLLERDPLT